jgi:Regulator of chromosome condensation (RCC1) repeat
MRKFALCALALLSCASPWDSLRDRSRQCTATRRDCDNDEANGCEVDLATDRQHCGECSTVARVACTGGRSLSLRSIAGAGATQCASLRGDSTHSIRCWGANDRQQVSARAAATVATPLDPAPGDASEVHAIGVGDGFGCAIRGDVRELSCWGRAVSPPSLAPTERLLSLRALAVGARHACVAVPRPATDESVVRCFGDNDRGQLGGTASAPSNIASVATADGQIFAMRGLRGLAAGTSHACAFDDRSVWCWGADDRGQLGRARLPGSAATAAAPVQFAATNIRVIDVAAAGESACAIVSDDAAGEDAGAAVGDGGDGGRAGDAQCAPSARGSLRASVLCWGALSAPAECGANIRPVLRAAGAPLEDAARVFVGGSHACAITTAGEVLCWGRGAQARFAEASPAAEPLVAVAIASLRGATELSITGAGNTLPAAERAAERESFCALMGAGSMATVKCWGPNDFAQLGDASRGVELLSSPAEVRW